MLVLLLQSFIAESNFAYNQKIKLVNANVLIGKNKEALKMIKRLNRKSIFTNNDLVRIERNLSLKVNQANIESNYRPRSMGDYVSKSLGYYQKKDYTSALAFTKMSLDYSGVSDTLIKLYEILAVHVPDQIPKKQKRLLTLTSKNIHLNEAMNLLELMKRKEKTLF